MLFNIFKKERRVLKEDLNQGEKKYKRENYKNYLRNRNIQRRNLSYKKLECFSCGVKFKILTDRISDHMEGAFTLNSKISCPICLKDTVSYWLKKEEYDEVCKK